MSPCLLINGGSFEQSASENKVLALKKKQQQQNNRFIGDTVLLAMEKREARVDKNVQFVC